MKLKTTLLILLALWAVETPAQDLLNKIKRRALEKGLEAIGADKGQKPSAPSAGTAGSQGSSAPGSPSNRTGGGLVSTPPDVNQNLSDAEAAWQAGNWGESRYSLQQAMLGVEMEIGQKILKSLPETITGLKKVEALDEVTSTGFGWVGLTIERVYQGGADKELKVIVANNAAWMTAVNMYLSGGGYAQATGGQQSMKQTRVKGYRAVIEYDEGSGYKLSVPVGQSSLIVYEGINFASEQEMTTAAGAIDIAGIKKMLGEQ
ncbi:MAG: hypothetical protein ACKOYP_00605 [Bacteroidota bacterium]